MSELPFLTFTFEFNEIPISSGLIFLDSLALTHAHTLYEHNQLRKCKSQAEFPIQYIPSVLSNWHLNSRDPLKRKMMFPTTYIMIKSES